jgi:hypothetical protein
VGNGPPRRPNSPRPERTRFIRPATDSDRPRRRRPPAPPGRSPKSVPFSSKKYVPWLLLPHGEPLPRRNARMCAHARASKVRRFHQLLRRRPRRRAKRGSLRYRGAEPRLGCGHSPR